MSTCQQPGGTPIGWTRRRPREGRPRRNAMHTLSLLLERLLCKRKKEMTMANWFEDFTKTVADEKIGRRTAIRRVAGTLIGATLASTLPSLTLAKSKQCLYGGTCSNGFPNCTNNPNCYCFTGARLGTAHCLCNDYCSSISSFDRGACQKNSDCPKGQACTKYNGCSGCGNETGICFYQCKGQHKNCTLPTGRTGMTGTGHLL